MDYTDAIGKLEALRTAIDKTSSGYTKQLHDEISLRYGEVEEILDRVLGVVEIEVPLSGEASMKCRNYIEAGFLSGRTIHAHAGRMQLNKAIGKVKQLASGSGLPALAPSFSLLVQILVRFRECCQYLQEPPKNEKAIQDITWIMLRSQFERVDREDTLGRFGTKSYRPDFGVPEIGVLIEVKFVGTSTSTATIQEEILADVPGYLQASSNYTGIVVLVYDAAHKLRDARKFIEDLRTVEGILEVIVIPGIG